MRQYDIALNPLPEFLRTPDMYVPPKKPVEDMTVEQLARGMCAKSQKNLSVCLACPARCSFGRELIRRVESGGKQKTDTV